MRSRSKTALWAVVSMVFFATVSARPLQGGDDKDVAKNDSVAKVDTVDSADPASVVDEVIWVVGDEPILLSDVEMARMQAEMEGVKWEGDPDCTIPEQLAVQKLFLHQAAIDSIEVSESEVAQSVEHQISAWLQMVDGNKERLEEYKRKSLAELRISLHDDFKDRLLIEREREKLVEDITVSPADVRRYFSELPEDSIPMVPTEVEVQIITRTPKVEQAEIDRIKNELRNYTEMVTSGQTSFTALAKLYSEDPGTARMGGEFPDYVGRGMLDPAFANVAFNLTDPKKISKIVETDFGYHIIQLIDKRGDKIKVRHILLKPNVSNEAIETASMQLDSIADEIRAGKFTFEQAASFLSDDKDTRNNNGLMANTTESGRTSKFQLRNLPSEIARVVDTLKVGEVSAPFQMINEKNGKLVCVVAKLKSRVEMHRATITEDFQTMKNIVLAKRKEEFIKDWIKDKIKNTYIRINDRYKNCNFEYQGWVK
ncbi:MULTISPECIES: peptidylprolyl isomerase [Prevotellaceae]|jgi:peptidyl-prolyl cis-trans isomerase SurA|uniref:peptidylprolyl isomerase n=1 Tax=Prevotellaceae TaxID=171552 RepID=UPI00033B86ED|nr:MULTISPECIES: peptidylprolyl isomerase [unclassified Prevotella]CCX69667.1 peptidyl-prolyl cis-trans isomerase [Prevotella sp. CAG:255]